MAEQEGLCYQMLNEWIFFWMNIPNGTLGPHIAILHEMFLHVASQGPERQNICATGAFQGHVREPNSEEDQSALHLIGYHTSPKELCVIGFIS